MSSAKESLIKNFQLGELRHDFMGYEFTTKRSLTYHHMIFFRRDGGRENYGNGVILVRDTSHDYLHLIEAIDQDVFWDITLYFMEQKNRGKIDKRTLKKIHHALLFFEKEHCNLRGKRGNLMIKEEYTKRLLNK